MHRKPVLQHEIYCRDHYFIDRLTEWEALFAFLNAENADAGSLFFVKGGMCRGKTVLLQRFADDVNQNKGKNNFQKRYKKVCEYSAYADVAWADLLKNSHTIELITPRKKHKGDTLVSGDTFSTFVSSVRQPI